MAMRYRIVMCAAASLIGPPGAMAGELPGRHDEATPSRAPTACLPCEPAPASIPPLELPAALDPALPLDWTSRHASGRELEFEPVAFSDQQSLRNRLRGVRRLPLLMLWDTRQASVFVGINRKGRPGLHLEQNDPRRPASERPRDLLSRAFDGPEPDDVEPAATPEEPPAATPAAAAR